MSRVLPGLLAGSLRGAREPRLVAAAWAASLACSLVPTAWAAGSLMAFSGHGFTPSLAPAGLDGALAAPGAEPRLAQWIGLALFALLWLVITGGALAHLARPGGAPPSLGALAGDGARLLPALLLLAGLGLAAAAALSLTHAAVDARLTAGADLWESERAVSLARAGVAGIFLAALGAASVVLRYARVAYVSLPEAGVLRGLGAGLRLVGRHPGPAFSLPAVAWAVSALLVVAFAWAPSPAPLEAGPGRSALILSVGQAAALAHAGLRMAVLGAESALWRLLGPGPGSP